DSPERTSVEIGRAAMSERRARPFAAFFGERAPRTDVDALLRKAAALSNAFDAVSDTMEQRMDVLRNTPSVMPTRGWLTGQFSRSRMHPILHELRPHAGIDVSAPA